MENITYVIEVIIPEGKNKQVLEREYEAFTYEKDENNNLRLITEDGSLIIEYHNYNWISIRPK